MNNPNGGFSIQALRAWHQYLTISVSIPHYFMKRYLTPWMSLNYPCRLLSLSPFTFLETLFYQFLSSSYLFLLYILFFPVCTKSSEYLATLFSCHPHSFYHKTTQKSSWHACLHSLPTHSIPQSGFYHHHPTENMPLKILRPPYWQAQCIFLNAPSHDLSTVTLLPSPTPPPGNPFLSWLLWWPTVCISSHQHEHSFSVHCMASIPIIAILPYVLFSPYPVA